MTFEEPLPSITLKEGIFPFDKPVGKTSFSLVHALRKKTGIQKIGHAGTLDPFASGVMILLIGKAYTKQAAAFTACDKEYLATLHLGVETSTYDPEGDIVASSSYIPSIEQIKHELLKFQGTVLQIPPMFSAKKIGGKRLYLLAREGISLERAPVEVTLTTTLLTYEYPKLTLKISCTKGTYIRSIGYDLGKLLGCGAHLTHLIRTRCGPYTLSECFSTDTLYTVCERRDHGSSQRRERKRPPNEKKDRAASDKEI